MKINTSKIKQLRKQKGLTQDAIAAKMGMGRVTYITRENSGDFTDKEIALLIMLLGTTESQICIKEDNSNLIIEKTQLAAKLIEEKDQLIAELRQTIARQEEHIRILFRIISKQNKEE